MPPRKLNQAFDDSDLGCTVRLIIHVLCEPAHFVLQSFIATVSQSIQTSFKSVMKDLPDKYHVRGTPTRSSLMSNS